LRRFQEGVVQELVAGLGEILLGPWTMILVAAGTLAGLAVGLPLTIMKALELIEVLFAKTGERLGRKPDRVRGLPRRRVIESRSGPRPSAPG